MAVESWKLRGRFLALARSAGVMAQLERAEANLQRLRGLERISRKERPRI